jgi:Tfp pilus assembly protein PilN
MKVIDFLPNDYLAMRNRHRANLACLAIAGTVMVALGLVITLLFVNKVGAGQVLAVVEQQYQQASQQLNELKQLEERKADLLRKVALSTTLLERVPRSNILARLTNHLPRGTSLTLLTMKVEEVEVRASEINADAKTDKSAAAAPANKNAKSGKPETVRMKQYVFRLDGVAPTDVEVAEYITRLNADALFRNVDLQFSEELAKEKDGVAGRRFQLMFRLNSSAEKVMESASDGDVAAGEAPAAVRGEL